MKRGIVDLIYETRPASQYWLLLTILMICDKLITVWISGVITYDVNSKAVKACKEPFHDHQYWYF